MILVEPVEDVALDAGGTECRAHVLALSPGWVSVPQRGALIDEESLPPAPDRNVAHSVIGLVTRLLVGVKVLEKGDPRRSVTMARVDVSNDELRTVRDAMRELNRMVDALESGDSEKFVLCQNNQMRAVVISVETFARLRGAVGQISGASLAT